MNSKKGRKSCQFPKKSGKWDELLKSLQLLFKDDIRKKRHWTTDEIAPKKVTLVNPPDKPCFPLRRGGLD